MTEPTILDAIVLLFGLASLGVYFIIQSRFAGHSFLPFWKPLVGMLASMVAGWGLFILMLDPRVISGVYHTILSLGASDTLSVIMSIVAAFVAGGIPLLLAVRLSRCFNDSLLIQSNIAMIQELHAKS